MYELSDKIIARQKIYTLKSVKNDTYLSVIGSRGASIHGLRLRGREIIKSWDDSKTLMIAQEEKFAGSQLFPFPNRLYQGQYELNGQTYHFSFNDFGKPSALHGHLVDKPMELLRFDKSKGEIHLSYNYNGHDPAYPFPYRITNVFILEDQGLKIRTIIDNLSDQKIPIGHGWHPYFTADLDKDHITIPSESTYIVDKNLIPTGDLKPYPYPNRRHPMATLDLDTCFSITETSPILMLHYADGSTLELHTGDYNFLQIYTPPDRQSIAIEPQTAAPDTFNNGIGLEYLEVGGQRVLQWAMALVSE